MNNQDIELIISLLKTAKCPDCDGSGIISQQTNSKQYVSREMALDAGDESLEGSLYSDDEWELEQCRWCYEKQEILKKYATT